MSRTKTSPAAPTIVENPSATPDREYRVVARRYRPQSFDEVVGQDHVVQTLRNAINLNRATHAYLFSGTRGVGKTSIARIFAKCLNCEHGPTDKPCNRCDICEAISVGQDVDVIEIDGASNNGVEQVRELRQNASLRPSRGRYKIYYIDEVHMLSKGAFDALLKTLEEPPDHVKFFFATTEPGKIPETVRSRCQRYDFAGISPNQIADTLAGICEREGATADRAALQTIARRAAGSMRDAQSMLEQVLAFEGRTITDQLVHDTLGLAPDERVIELLEAIASHDTASALSTLNQALASGVQTGDLLGALLEFVRDVMVLSAGGGEELLGSAPSVRERLAAIASGWPLETSMAALQILAEARGRMRGSPHGRILLELATCRCARLEDLVEIAALAQGLLDGEISTAGPIEPAKKKRGAVNETGHAARPIPNSTVIEPPAEARSASSNGSAASVEPDATQSVVANFRDRPLTLETFREAWPAVRERMPAPLNGPFQKLEPADVPEPGVLVVSIVGPYNYLADQLERADSATTVEKVFREIFGRPVSVKAMRVDAETVEKSLPRSPKRIARHEDLDADPMVKDLQALFDARPVHIETDDATEAD